MSSPALLLFLCLASADAMVPTPENISAVIDQRIEATAADRQTPLAPPASDAEFFRRLTLDLRGHTPAPQEVLDFLSDPNGDKRRQAIRAALDHPDHRRHFATIWRRLLLPEAESQAQIQYFLPGFEAWLENARQADRAFDAIVRDLVAAPIHGTPDNPQMVLTDLAAPNPIAYIATKEADPGKIAAGVTRLFLGVRLECAQCHDHPFDKWTRQQFWNQAAFFSGISRRGRGTFAPVVEARQMRSIEVMETGETVEAVFLTGETPTIREGRSPRAAYAEWMTSRENPFFAKAVVNRVWSQLMGTGLVDPVDDFQSTNPPSHPELLDELAQAFADSGFQLDVLYAGICGSAAYQRTSRQSDAAQADPHLFARMAIKPMTAEQLYDSLQSVLVNSAAVKPGSRPRNDRRQFLDLFATPEASGEPITSMPQVLYLMNSTRIETAVKARGVALAAQTNDELAIQQVFLETLSRLPVESERQTAMAFLNASPTRDRAALFGDLYWSMLNLPEFRWNH